MITCLVTAKHAYTWTTFLETWGKAMDAQFTILDYEEVLKEKRPWDGKASYLFCDLDRLSFGARARLGPLHAALCEGCGSARVLNDPVHSMQRFDLLRTLHAAGLNRFDVQWIRRREVPGKFPVLVRPEIGSPQLQLPLLADAAAYRSGLESISQAGIPLDGWIAVEFCDTADKDGVYRKYGAFIVGRTIVPRHVFFSRNWMVKKAELTSAPYVEEELAYLDQNPHEQALAAIARMADIGYGRIDYAMLDGRVQTWEINTNPMIASPLSEEIPERRDVHLKFVSLFGRALRALESR